MGELLSALLLAGAVFAGGWWFGRRGAEAKNEARLRGSTPAPGKCMFCGTPIEGGSWDMDAHVRFYCRPPAKKP